MTVLHLEQGDWLTTLRVVQSAPAAVYDRARGKFALFFDAPGLGRVYLSVGRGGVRLWSPEAATRFLAGVGMSWSVVLGPVDGIDSQHGELVD